MIAYLIAVLALAGMTAWMIWQIRKEGRHSAPHISEERQRAELCRHAVTDGVCRYECDICPWHWDEQEAG